MTAENPSDLRRIGLALRRVADEQRQIDEAVAAARENGRSWSEIGLVLGISRQTARERYGHHPSPVVTYLAGGQLCARQRSYRAAIDLRRHRRTR